MSVGADRSSSASASTARRRPFKKGHPAGRSDGFDPVFSSPPSSFRSFARSSENALAPRRASSSPLVPFAPFVALSLLLLRPSSASSRHRSLSLAAFPPLLASASALTHSCFLPATATASTEPSGPPNRVALSSPTTCVS